MTETKTALSRSPEPTSAMTHGVSSLQVREYLEKQYEEKAGKEAIKLAIKALTETVEAGSKNMEVSIGCCRRCSLAPTQVRGYI